MRILILSEYSRILEAGFDSNPNSLWRIRIYVSEFEFEFGEFSRHLQNSYLPNIREFEFELGEFFSTPVDYMRSRLHLVEDVERFEIEACLRVSASNSLEEALYIWNDLNSLTR
jgi:hypothetical protein